MVESWEMKKQFASSVAPAVRLAMRFSGPGLSRLIWDNAVQGKLDWRHFAFVKPSHFGSDFAGDTIDGIQRYIYFFGCWEPQVEAVISRILKPGDCFVDVGANIGYFTLMAATLVGPTGQVFAFEACRKTFGALSANLRRNHVGASVHAAHAAVADRETTLNLYAGPEDNCGESSLVPHDGGTVESVQAKPLAQLLPENTLDSARLIKVDVEGAEHLVIAGLESHLDKMNGDLLVELNPKTEAIPQILDRLLKSGRCAFEIMPTDSLQNYFHAPLRAQLRSLHDVPSRRCDVLFTRSSANDLRGMKIEVSES